MLFILFNISLANSSESTNICLAEADSGLLNFEIRSDSSNISCWACDWLSRSGFAATDAKVVINGMSWTLYIYNKSSRYGRVYFTEISRGSINGSTSTFGVTYYNSTTPESATPAATYTSKDASEPYPVGSVYASWKNTSPANLFGGTWEKIATDRVLMGASADSKLATTINSGLPNITGQMTGMAWNKQVGFYHMELSGAFVQIYNAPSGRITCEDTYWASGGNDATLLGFNASKSNGIYGGSSIVQPPAYYVYYWRRTA